MTPVVELHSSVGVVRDDLFPGGTKARFVARMFDDTDEIVYASPAQGGAQFALAHVAQQLGKRATIFVARRRVPHPRQIEARRLGAKYVLVKEGRLNVVQARAREYAAQVGATLAPFGFDAPEAIDIIAAAASSIGDSPDEVWCAAGSGTLCRALRTAWPSAEHVAVAVGRDIEQAAVGGAKVIRYPAPFERHSLTIPPFPSDPHYDAKAWEICLLRKKPGARVMFWNVAGPAKS
jgi:hypothetical protein